MATPQQGRKRTATGRDHEAIVEAHVGVGRCPKIDALFKAFLVNVLDKKPGELPTLCDYQIPHGKLEVAPGSEKPRVLHLLHWPNNANPPSTQSGAPSGPAEFLFDSYTLKIVTDVLPGSQNDHVFSDYVPKHMKIKDEYGNRRTNQELYGDLPLDECVELMYNLIIEGDFDVVIVHGGPARRALKKRLGLPKDRGGGRDYEMMDVVIGDKQRTLTFLPHGKFIGRWADAGVRKIVANLLEGLHVRFDIPINISGLERRLQSREELKLITMPRRTPEELKLYKIEYKKEWAAMKSGRKAWPGECEESRAARHEKAKVAEAAKMREWRTRPGKKAKGAATMRKRRATSRGQQVLADYKPRRAELERAKIAQKPDETDEDFAIRDKSRRDAMQDYRKDLRARKLEAEAAKPGQQQLGAFFKPMAAPVVDTDTETKESDVEDAVAGESDLDDVETDNDVEDLEDQ